MKKALSLALALAVAWTAAPAGAEIIILKDGRRRQGTITKLERGEFVLAKRDGTVERIPEVDVKDVLLEEGSEVYRRIDEYSSRAMDPSVVFDLRLQALRGLADLPKSYPYLDPPTLDRILRLLLRVGKESQERDEHRLAVEALIEAMRLAPHMVEGLRGPVLRSLDVLAEQELSAGEIARAAEDYQKIAEWDPSRREAMSKKVVALWRNEAARLLRKREYEAALVAVERGLQVVPGDPDLLKAAEQARFERVSEGTREAPGTAQQAAEQLSQWEGYLTRASNEEYVAEARRRVAMLQQELEVYKREKEGRLAELYAPLRAGNRWLYRGERFTEELRVAKLERSERELVADIIHTSAEAVPAEQAGPIPGGLAVPQPYEYRYQMARNARGLFQRQEAKQELRLSFPVRVGAGWTERVGTIGYEWTYVSTGEEIVTRAGLFRNCLLVKLKATYPLTELPPKVILFYYAPHVGLVRVDWTEGDEMDWELESYFIAPPGPDEPAGEGGS